LLQTGLLLSLAGKELNRIGMKKQNKRANKNQIVLHAILLSGVIGVGVYNRLLSKLILKFFTLFDFPVKERFFTPFLLEQIPFPFNLSFERDLIYLAQQRAIKPKPKGLV
jgi:hypothetical protein